MAMMLWSRLLIIVMLSDVILLPSRTHAAQKLFPLCLKIIANVHCLECGDIYRLCELRAGAYRLRTLHNRPEEMYELSSSVLRSAAGSLAHTFASPME